MDKLEKQEDQKQIQKKEQKPAQPVNPMQKTSGAERNMKIVVKGGRSTYNEVESLKEKVRILCQIKRIINVNREICSLRAWNSARRWKCIVSVSAKERSKK